MIYRVEFIIYSSTSKLISPVIYGCLIDKLFELVNEQKANEIIKKIIANKVLISDAQPMIENKGKWYRCFYKINIPKLEETPENITLRQKRDNQRKRKHETGQLKLLCINEEGINETLPPKKIYNSIEFTRIGIQVDRIKETSEEGILFYHQEFRFNIQQRYAIYIKLEDVFLRDVFEQCFKAIELTGFGPDASKGSGKIKFIKNNDRILQEDYVINNIFIKEKANKNYVNISSTLLDYEIEKECNFVEFFTLRYDSKSKFGAKPPYFYAQAGSIVKAKDGIMKFRRYKKVYIFTCVFPLNLI
ncbi:hypothetical protein ACAG39_10315 [Caldicellulosiruptoraceae bacterium PP1]